MLTDDLIDSIINEQYLPGVRTIDVSNADGSIAFTVCARREDVTNENLQSLGVASATVGGRIYFVWIAQANYVPIRSQWTINEEDDGTSWKIVTVEAGIQSREVVCTCTRSRTATVGT